MITNRVNYKDLDINELQELVLNMLDDITWSNRDFKCSQCLETYNNLLLLLSLFTESDKEYNALETLEYLLYYRTGYRSLEQLSYYD